MTKYKSILLFLDGPVYHKTTTASFWFDLTRQRVEGIADEMFVLSHEEPPPVDFPTLSFSTARDFLEWLETYPPHTEVILVPAYAPFIQRHLLEDALTRHITYLFDYTYAELPAGLMGEILDSSIAFFLKRSLPEDAPLFHKSLKEWLGQDLSSYDCNIVFTDIRLLEYRLSFLPENHYQAAVLKAMTQENTPMSSLEEIRTWIHTHPDALRQVPTFVEIELNTIHESSGPFAVDLERKNEMPPELLSSLLSQIDTFAPDAVISFGLYGEVFAYSHWDALLAEIAARPDRRFLLESRGIFLPPRRVEEALALPNVEIIIDISTTSSELFQQWKKPSSPVPFEGLPGLEFLHQHASCPRLYIQMTRTHENDKELMRFYETWKDFTGRIIIRKPDSFGGINLPARVVDLSPMKRTPCVALQRNLVVFADGTVPLCRQDKNGQYRVGHVLRDGVERCWRNLSEAYEKQIQTTISTPLCERCDDWWIFSF